MVTYTHSNQFDVGLGSVNAANFVWNTANHLVAALHAGGWVTRGSSSQLGYSATPDGQDYWTGEVYTNAFAPFSTDPVWHVLESIDGRQVCVEVNGFGGLSAAHVTIAKNKFESGGAWRSAVSTNVRPEDVTSLPISCREIASDQLDFPFGLSVMSNVAVRDDGKGFVWHVRDTAETQKYIGFICAAVNLTEPLEGDENPIVLLTAPQLTAYVFVTDIPDSMTYPIWSRVGTSVDQVTHSMVTLGAFGVGLFLQSGAPLGPDPYSNAEIQYPISLFTQAEGGLVRRSVSDIYLIRSNGQTGIGDGPQYGDTFNDKDRLVVGDWSIPWDGATDMGGTDTPAVVQSLVAIPPPSAIGGSGSAARKSFNLGMERI